LAFLQENSFSRLADSPLVF